MRRIRVGRSPRCLLLKMLCLLGIIGRGLQVLALGVSSHPRGRLVTGRGGGKQLRAAVRLSSWGLRENAIGGNGDLSTRLWTQWP